jgi:CubicO group peptidase (beta-lactamase class C family)
VKERGAVGSATRRRLPSSGRPLRWNPASALLLTFALLPTSCGSAAEQGTPPIVDPAELEAFADSFFAAKMEELRIPGVAFIFVEGGEVVLAKGYGYADLEKRTPMSADTTVMRIGSVSKVFVATAAMQLVEQGRLDLDADINQYLTTFHTAGFEDPPYVSNTDPALARPLGPYLAETMSARTDAPGATYRYSNHGFALAAYVVEEVSGQPFDQYVAEHIMRPLGMAKSGYLLSPPLPEGLAMGYSYQDGAQVPQPVDYDSDYPGGSIVSTGADMARFMLAHLQDGCYQGACILRPETEAEMHRSRAETPYEGQRVTYGFTEGTKDGQRLLGHSGAIRGFGSIMDLLPEHNMGYFFSFNEECYATSACDIIPAFREQFLERFLSPSGGPMTP